MSTLFGGGLESTTLPDVKAGDDDLLPLDDDFEISFSDDDPSQQLAPPAAAPLRGQNEDDAPGQNGHSGDPDLADIENPRIRDRIMRERRLREEAETRAQRETEQIEQALLQSEKTKIAIQRDAFRLSLDGVDVRIRTATEALKMARADGDTNAETDLEAQVSELRQVRGNLEQQMGHLPREADLDRAYAEHVSSRKQLAAQRRPRDADDSVRPLNDKAAQWARNNTWMSDRTRTVENQALLTINNSLVNEGYDANSDDFFVEMSRRLARTFPALGVKDMAGRQIGGTPQQQGQRRASPPVADARTQAPASARVSMRTVELDRTDRAMMRQLGIDPSDKAKVKRFAKEKFERLRSEQRGY